MAVIDLFTFNGEKDLLRLHLGCLGGYVDKFVIVEANQTFTGHPKPLYFFRDQHYFKPWWHQIEYYVVSDWNDEALWDMARQSPLTKGAEHWKREFYVKESIKKALASLNLNDDDTVHVGDVDEVWDFAYKPQKPIEKLKLRVYNYYLNNRSNEAFWGTLVAKYGDIKDACLNEMRNNKEFRSESEAGWHFSSMGGLKEVQRKLDDTYTVQSYNMNLIPGHVEQCLTERKDLLNRPFTYEITEADWPRYLRENRSRYNHLLWQQ